MTEPESKRPAPDRLLVSGIELEITNPSLAASLSEALGEDAEETTPVVIDQRTVTEGVPDTVVTLTTARAETEERMRRELRSRVEMAGISLGFEVSGEGRWGSETEVTILTRVNERRITPAAAVHFVTEVERPVRNEYERGSALFIVAHPDDIESYAVAIRYRATCDRMRAISIDDLERLAALVVGGSVRHAEAAAILSPIGGIDAGTLIDVVARVLTPEGE